MSDETSADAGSTVGSTIAPAPEQAQSERLYTQTELDNIVTERVNKSKAQFKDYSELKQRASQLGELTLQYQTLQQEKAALEADFNLAASDAIKLKVALDKGVPADLVDRLRGQTPEEIAADAVELMSKFQPAPTFQRGFNGGTSPGATIPTAESADTAIRRAAGY